MRVVSGAPPSRRLAWRRPAAALGAETAPNQPARTPAFRLIALVALLVIACGGEKPDDAATSWTATLQMTAEKWAANSVPSRFVRATCDSAKKALEQASKKPADDETRKKLEKALAAAGKLRDAAERGDRGVGRQVAEELRKP